VEANTGAGIFHEVSYDAVIRDNVVKGNGFSRGDWLWGAGIQIAASQNVEVYGNVVDRNANGIALIQQNRGSGAYGPYLVQNDYVHDNVVTMTTGHTGAVQDVGDTSIFTTRNNRFVHNTYHLGTQSTYFAWMNGWLTAAQWVAYGQDATGTFLVLPA
jgi:hypothetical protein